MEITLLNENNFCHDSLDSFSRYQIVEYEYRLIRGELQLRHNPVIDDWSAERKREKAAEILSGQHIVYGAVDGNRIVGIILLCLELDHNRMIIDSFHVSADKRRCGIGRKLFEAAKKEAKKRGAAALYVSASPAQETIDFYVAMGFKVSSNPIEAYADDEPCDIQMECEI
ncbi:MAG: GNAT family N-acetyltransferase [Oscillospiraceae bacterium]|nr:GNAT family N-acetyltransferase [Oscillospiraceae bacterium]